MKYIIAIIALCVVTSTSAQNKTFTVSGQTFEMVKIEGGTFKTGLPLSMDQTNYYDQCRPVHDVTLSTHYVGKFPVTQKLWSAVMGELDCPSLLWGDNFPVDNVSWKLLVQARCSWSTMEAREVIDTNLAVESLINILFCQGSVLC